ncbi:MAG: N-acetylmuramoyl-L-alanine amidase [Candidatus Sumerlaeaceae bacterium]
MILCRLLIAPAIFFAAILFSSSQDATAAQGAQPSICSRGCWLARNPGPISYMSTLNRAIIHHTADANHMNTTGLEASKANVRAVQNFHMDTNGWSDIGYHYLVDKFGNIFEGRYGSNSSLPKGAHDSYNVNSFGFNIMGYFHTPYNQQPTSAMLDSLMDVIAWRMPSSWSAYGSGSYNGRTVGVLDGHRKVKSTACPGDYVHPNYITENYNGGPMRDGVMQRKNGSGGVFAGNRKGIARTSNGGGYWIVAADGGVFSFGNAGFYGALPGQVTVNNIVGMAARPQSDGYWLVGSDGGVFSFGAAGFYGSMGGQPLSQPVVAICSTASGAGYWLVGKDGGIFAFGDAPYHGSVPGVGINITNVITMASNPSNGYWIMASDGGIFTFGPAGFHGSAGGSGLTDFVGMAARSDGGGYWLARSNGSIYSYGAVNYQGGVDEPGKFVGIAAGPSTWNGYWLVKNDGAVYSFGDAAYYGGAN